MARICEITGRQVGRGNNVSHSKRRTKRTFMPNLRKKRIFVESENRWITLKVSAAGLRTINRIGIEAALKQAYANGWISRSL